jgi:hypothetical protein
MTDAERARDLAMEELAIKIFEAVYGVSLSWLRRDDGKLGRHRGAALIDAELRKERERCAERAGIYCENHFAHGGFAGNLHVRAAILKEPAAPDAPSVDGKA